MSDMSDFTYEDYRNIVEEHLSDYLPPISEHSAIIEEAMKYSLEAGGKRLRPVLVLATCDFCGGEIKDALPYACAIEYMHTYSLIHDDLPCMDDDDLRRGKPTNHKVFGENMAVLAGDGLQSAAFEAMIKNQLLFFDNDKKLKQRINACNEIVKGSGCQGMLVGQVADVENEGKECSGEMLDFIHLNKTAALIVAAVRAGAYLGGADAETLHQMTEYAEAIGLAFQIKDDLLDISGNEEELGKKTGVDAEKNKNTYPLIYGVEASEQRLEELKERALQSIAQYYDNAEFFATLVETLHQRNK